MSPSVRWRADLKAIHAIARREVTRFLRAKSRIVASIAMPLIWFCAFGLGLGSAFGMKYGEINYAEFLAPGIVAMTVLFAATFSGMSIILVLGKLLGGMATSLIRAILIVILFCVMLEIEMGVLEYCGVFVVVCMIAIGFGGLAIAIATKMESMEGFGLIVELVVMPIFFLSGAFFPVDKLPGWLSTVVMLNPLTYGVDALRLLMIGTGSFGLLHDLGVLIVFDVVVVLFAAYLFEKV